MVMQIKETKIAVLCQAGNRPTVTSLNGVHFLNIFTPYYLEQFLNSMEHM